ncbi:MAG: hypothetical protein JW821_09915 [Deltaproteobacteria bacterium]|nr:hypothetical protein [Deltaproteobacteria bacterium]
MNRKTRFIVCGLIVLVLTFASLRVAYSQLGHTYAQVIRIAYMNGYVAAMRQDMEEIRRLKEDETRFREKVEDAAKAYLNTVSKMNMEK